ncbi:MAG TPA: hypothetical protein O0Y08_04610, partial [Methanocorpusculum sp.]|nr:hypothetical protein [Methanocorpusculum sp.]
LSACGADCMACELRAACRGCIESCGKPFGRTCMVFSLYEKGDDVFSAFRQKLIDTINRLEIDGLEPVTELYALKGSFINPAVTLPNGDVAKFLDDNKIYLGHRCRKETAAASWV